MKKTECLRCKTHISLNEAAMYDGMCSDCSGAQTPYHEIILKGCVDGIESIRNEEERLSVIESLFNCFLHGVFCDDGQKLAPMPSAKDPTVFELKKADEAKKIQGLRDTMPRIIQ